MKSYTNTENTDPPVISTKPLIKEFHCCMGLNACKGHDRLGANECAGQGVCATVNHSCHTLNNCRNQGGCGLYGPAEAQAIPGVNECAWLGSCASPINAERFITNGQVRTKEEATKGESYDGESVWQRARKVFEEKMTKIKREFGPPPKEALQDGVAVGPPTKSYINKTGAFPGCASCGSSGMSGGGSCG